MRIKPATAPGHVAVACENRLRSCLGRVCSQKITDISVAGHEHPVGCRLFFQVHRTNENPLCANFVGTQSEIVGPIGRSQTAAISRKDVPRVLIAVVVRPNSKRHAGLSQIVQAGNAFGLGFGAGERRKQEARQNRNDGNNDEQLDEGECGGSSIRSHTRRIRP